MTHLLDTDTCIGVLRQRPGTVQRLSQIAPEVAATPLVADGVGDASSPDLADAENGALGFRATRASRPRSATGRRSYWFRPGKRTAEGRAVCFRRH